MIDVKKSANRFVKKYISQDIDVESIEGVIRQQGYTLVYFRAQNNTDEVDTVLNSLNLVDMARHSRGFVYADEKYRLVFINEDLTDKEKLIVLLHEEGHIFLEHTRNHKVIGLDVIEEHEANEFVHYVLYVSPLMMAGKVIKKYRVVFIGVLVAVVVVAVGALSYRKYTLEQTYYGEYYVTKTGTKYHTKECGLIEDSDIRRLTKEDMESGKYEPCSVCIGKETE